MKLATYVAYVIASFAVMAAPGPTVMLVVSHAMGWGQRRCVYTILGIALSCSILFAAFALGAAVLLRVVAELFVWIKLAGAAYLVWLGVRQWRGSRNREGELVAAASGDGRPGSLALQGFVVNLTNPGSLLFFAAFLPPFLDPTVRPGPQLLIMGVTFVAILVAVCLGYAVLAERGRRFFMDRKQLGVVNKAAGALLIAIAVLLVAAGNP